MDKAFDSDALVATLNERGAQVVVSQQTGRKHPIDIDREIYTWRHLIENTFGKLEEFKAIAMRDAKTDASFSAFIKLVATAINCR